MKLSEQQKLILLQLLSESLSLYDRGLFSLNRQNRSELYLQIIRQQDQNLDDDAISS